MAMERYVYSVNPGDIVINKTELAMRLKAPKGFTNETIEKCLNLVKESIKPAGCYVKTPIIPGENTVGFEFASFVSEDLCKCLSGCREAYVMAVTLGIGTDRLIKKLSLISGSEGFIADAVASAYAEALLDNMCSHLEKEAAITPRFSPGYGDLDISVQREILDFLNADKIMALKLSENYIMIPRKSITAICGIKE